MTFKLDKKKMTCAVVGVAVAGSLLFGANAIYNKFFMDDDVLLTTEEKEEVDSLELVKHERDMQDNASNLSAVGYILEGSIVLGSIAGGVFIYKNKVLDYKKPVIGSKIK